MFDHFIAFKAENLDPATEAELMARLGALSEIPGILGFALGKNVSSRARGFDYCMRITFDSSAAHDAYQAHPRHLEVVAYNRQVTTEHICMDFEWESRP